MSTIVDVRRLKVKLVVVIDCRLPIYIIAYTFYKTKGDNIHD